ncbi:MAG: hypothetical protein KF810_23220 [Rhizobiaceae bacterium]|nr:hypothetical protein [Rhizobiaceae bacterium]
MFTEEQAATATNVARSMTKGLANIEPSVRVMGLALYIAADIVSQAADEEDAIVKFRGIRRDGVCSDHGHDEGPRPIAAECQRLHPNGDFGQDLASEAQMYTGFAPPPADVFRTMPPSV